MKLVEVESFQVIKVAPWRVPQPGRDGKRRKKQPSYAHLIRNFIDCARLVLAPILHLCFVCRLNQYLEMACVGTVTPDLMLGMGAAIFGIVALVLFASLPMHDAWIDDDDDTDNNSGLHNAKQSSWRMSFDEDGFLEAFGHAVENLTSNAVELTVQTFHSLLKSFAEPETTLFSDLTRLSEASSTFVNDVRDLLSCSVPVGQAMAQSRLHLERSRPAPVEPSESPLNGQGTRQETIATSSLVLAPRKPPVVSLRRNFGSLGPSLHQSLSSAPLPSKAIYDVILASAFAESKIPLGPETKSTKQRNQFQKLRSTRKLSKLRTATSAEVHDKECKQRSFQIAPASLFRDFNWLALLPKPEKASLVQPSPKNFASKTTAENSTSDEIPTLPVKRVRFSEKLTEIHESVSEVPNSPVLAPEPALENPKNRKITTFQVRDSDGGWFHKRTTRSFRSLRMRHSSMPVSRSDFAQLDAPREQRLDVEEDVRLSFDSTHEDDFSAMLARSFYKGEFSDSIAKSLVVENIEPLPEKAPSSTVVSLRKIVSGDKLAQMMGKASVEALGRSNTLLGKMKRHVSDASPRRLNRTRQFQDDKKAWESRFSPEVRVDAAYVH